MHAVAFAEQQLCLSTSKKSFSDCGRTFVLQVPCQYHIDTI